MPIALTLRGLLSRKLSSAEVDANFTAIRDVIESKKLGYVEMLASAPLGAANLGTVTIVRGSNVAVALPSGGSPANGDFYIVLFHDAGTLNGVAYPAKSSARVVYYFGAYDIYASGTGSAGGGGGTPTPTPGPSLEAHKLRLIVTANNGSPDVHTTVLGEFATRKNGTLVGGITGVRLNYPRTDTGFTPDKAIDGDPATYSQGDQSAGNQPLIWVFDVPASKADYNELWLYSGNFASYAPKNFTIERLAAGAADTASGTVIATVTNATTYGDGPVIVYLEP